MSDGPNGNDSAKVWDLTEPPTRSQVKMEDGRYTVIYETDEPRDVTLKLPEDVSLTLPLELLTFDSMGSRSPSDIEPTGLDAKTDRVSLDETIRLYRSALEQVGMKTDQIQEFERKARAAEGRTRISAPLITRTYGYLTFRVLAQYEPDSEVGYVKLMGSWDNDLPKSESGS